MLVPVREIARDLAPVALVLLLRLRAERVVGLGKALLVVGIDPPAIPMDVDDAEHSRRSDPVRDLGNALDLVAVDLPVMGIGVPGNRQANDVKAERLQALDVFLGDWRIAPTG